MRRLLPILLSLSLLGAAGASADDPGEADLVPVPLEVPAAVEDPVPAAIRYGTPSGPHVPADGRAAIDAWDDVRGYRYGTDYLFPFTRGMDDAGIRGWARYPAAVLTVPLDVALLPVGAIAGLWGG